MSYCKNCGNEISENAKFCGKCGMTVEILVSESEEQYGKVLPKKRRRKFLRITMVIVILIFLASGVLFLGKNIIRNLQNKESEMVYRVIETKREIIGNASANEVTKHSYDTEGNHIRMVFDANGKVVSKEVEKYNESDKLVSQKCYDETGGLTEHIEYVYDEMGNCVEEQEYAGDGSLTKRTERTFDEAGNCVEQHEYAGDGSLTRRRESQFNENGDEVVFADYYDIENDQYAWGKYEYVYDENGNCLNRKGYNSRGELLESVEKKYDKKGNCISSIIYDESGSPFQRVEYMYDNNGYVVRERTYLYETKTDTSDLEYIYDDNGNVIKINIYYEGELSVVITYIYEAIEGEVA